MIITFIEVSVGDSVKGELDGTLLVNCINDDAVVCTFGVCITGVGAGTNFAFGELRVVDDWVDGFLNGNLLFDAINGEDKVEYSVLSLLTIDACLDGTFSVSVRHVFLCATNVPYFWNGALQFAQFRVW